MSSTSSSSATAVPSVAKLLDESLYLIPMPPYPPTSASSSSSPSSSSISSSTFFDVRSCGRDIKVVALRLPASETNHITMLLRSSGALLDIPKVKPVVKPEDEEKDHETDETKKKETTTQSSSVSTSFSASSNLRRLPQRLLLLNDKIFTSLDLDACLLPYQQQAGSAENVTTTATATSIEVVVNAITAVKEIITTINAKHDPRSTSSSNSSDSNSSTTTTAATVASNNNTSNNANTTTVCSLEYYTLHLGHEHASLETLLRAMLPKEASEANQGELPTGFEIVGHLAHMNLKDEFLPWRYVIGQLVLLKNPGIRTVINKTGNIENVFRTFPMEVIAGEDDTIVEMRHCNAYFNFDFRTVYWNSRLQCEHQLLVEKYIPPRSIVADMFCGVGPFAIPLAMMIGGNGSSTNGSRGRSSSSSSSSSSSGGVGSSGNGGDSGGDGGKACTVYANDLNPASVASLVSNLHKNRKLINNSITAPASCGVVHPFNMDGRDFIRYLVAVQRVPFQHVIMNLPADALSFCDVFIGLFRHQYHVGTTNGHEGGGAGGEKKTTTTTASNGMPSAPNPPLPRIHVYCFSRAENEAEAGDDVIKRLLDVLRLPALTKEEIAKGAEKMAAAASSVSSSSTKTTKTTKTTTTTAAAASGGVESSGIFAARNIVGVLPDLLIRSVRNVAPAKLMMCASFTLPQCVADAEPVVTGPIPTPPDVEALKSLAVVAKPASVTTTGQNNSSNNSNNKNGSSNSSSGGPVKRPQVCETETFSSSSTSTTTVWVSTNNKDSSSRANVGTGKAQVTNGDTENTTMNSSNSDNEDDDDDDDGGNAGSSSGGTMMAKTKRARK